MKSLQFSFKPAVLVWLMILFVTVANATTYYSKGSLDATSNTSWSSTADGSGASPNATQFGQSTHTFIIQSGHNMSQSKVWTFSSGIDIKFGGSLTTSDFTINLSGTLSISGKLLVSGSETKTFGGAITVNSGGNLTIDNTTGTIFMNSNLVVASGATFMHKVNYLSANYLQINGNLDIQGTYDYTGFAPAIWMNGSGDRTINTGSTSLYYLLIRKVNLSAAGPVTVDGPFYASWNEATGAFHTNGKNVIAKWGLVNSGGTLYIDGGSLDINGAVGGLLSGSTVPLNTGKVIMSSGTLNTPGISMGSGTNNGSFTFSGGTINTGSLSVQSTGSSFTCSNSPTLNISGSLNNAGTFTTITGGAPAINITGDLTNSGNITNSGTSSPAMVVAGDVNNSGTLTMSSTSTLKIGGDWINNGTSVSSGGTTTFNGTTSQTIGGSASSTFNNLTINNAAGVSFLKDETVNSTLTLTSGRLSIGSNNLILGSSAAAVAGSFSAANMIVADGAGEVRKNFSAKNSYFFPIGDNTVTAGYSPVTLNFTSGTFAAGAYAGVKVTNAKHPNNASSTDFLNRYWSVSNSGITSTVYNVTASYLPEDISGVPANIVAAKYTGSAPLWTKYAMLASNTLTANAVSNTGTGIIFTGISNILPTVTISEGITICPGGSTQLNSVVTNATASTTYAWTPTAGLSSSTIANPVASPSVNTSYSLKVTDGNGFTANSNSLTVIPKPAAPAKPAATVTAQPTCSTTTGTITVTAPTGMTYSIDGTNYGTGTVFIVAPGTHNVTAKNSSGCVSPATSLVVNQQPARATGVLSGTQAICKGSPATLKVSVTGTGTISGTLSNGTAFSGTAPTIMVNVSPAVETTYSIATLTNGTCASIESDLSGSAIITVNSEILNNQLNYINGSNGVICATPDENGTATLTAPANTVFTTVNFASYGKPTGTCNTFTIDPTCHAVNSQSIVETYLLGKNFGSIPATNGVFTDPCVGIGKRLYISATYTQPICSGSSPGTIAGTIPTGGSGTYTYLWEMSTTGAAGPFSPAAGTNDLKDYVAPALTQTTWYRRTVFSVCSNVSPVIVVPVTSLPAAPTATITQPTCTVATGTITITAPTEAGMGYSIDGSTYTNTTGIFTNLTAQSYNVTAKNSVGCISPVTSVTINSQPTTPAAPTATVTQPTCTVATGTVTITASAGITYSFNGGSYSSSTVFAGLNQGTYSITAKNSNGCISPVTSVTVNPQPTLAAPTATVTQPTCTVATGTITITAPKGSGMKYNIDGSTYTNTTGIFTNLTPKSYNVTAKNTAGCISPVTNVTVDFQPATPAPPIASNNGPVCVGSTLTLSASSAASNVSYSWTGPNGFVSSLQNPAFPYSTSSSGIYSVKVTSGSCTSAAATTTVASTTTPGLWTGNISREWNNGQNWCDGKVPDLATSITIPATTNHPLVSIAIGSGQNVDIATGATLTITGQTLQISGNITGNGVIDARKGTIEMDGTSGQTISGKMFLDKTVHNLVVSSIGGNLVVAANGNDTLKISGTLSFGDPGSKIITNDNITLLSSDIATASVGIVGPQNAITGKVVVERYINSGTVGSQHPKSWQFLAISTIGQTVQESWMEGNAPTLNAHPGYGTQITGPGGTAAGFDMTTPSPSLKYYDYVTGTWVGVTNTSKSIYNPKGYMVFVRGDRNVDGATVKNATPTILRTKGNLFTGTTAAIEVAKNKYESIGNPYASAIDFSLITKGTGVDDVFYAWDPYLYGSYGLGGYQTISLVNDWEPVPGGTRRYPTAKTGKIIKSGQAFLVHATENPSNPSQTYTLTISENSKVSGSAAAGIGRESGDNLSAKKQIFSTKLFSGTVLADGNTVVFGKNYSNEIDRNDAQKMANSGENFGMKRNGKILAVEAKQPAEGTDTIFYNMSNLKQQTYQLFFTPKNMESGSLSAFLIDGFLNTSTPISLSDTSSVNITITSAAASWAVNRFKVVFKQMTVLPVTITSIKAYKKNSNIEVSWKVENENGIQQYEVESSANGNTFRKAGTVAASNKGIASYIWEDKDAPSGFNYYRVKSLGSNGEIKYTQIVKIFIESELAEISVYPNPIVGQTINLQLKQQPAGNYGIRLLNNLGQVILSQKITHEGGSNAEAIKTEQRLAKGIYQLEITKPGGEIKVIKVMN